MIFLSKYFGSEGLDLGPGVPCVEVKAGFSASLFEKRDAIPVMLDGDLGQKQAAATGHADEQTVAADFDGVGRDRLRRRENTQLNLEMWRLVTRDRRKATVFESGGASGIGNRAIDGIDG